MKGQVALLAWRSRPRVTGISKSIPAAAQPTLVDLDEEKVVRGIETIRGTLGQGAEHGIFTAEQVVAIMGRVEGSCDWERLADADLIVEAVFSRTNRRIARTSR